MNSNLTGYFKTRFQLAITLKLSEGKQLLRKSKNLAKKSYIFYKKIEKLLVFMANENKNQDDLNANELKDGEDKGNFSGKAANNETPGKKRRYKSCAIFQS